MSGDKPSDDLQDPQSPASPDHPWSIGALAPAGPDHSSASQGSGDQSSSARGVRTGLRIGIAIGAGALALIVICVGVVYLIRANTLSSDGGHAGGIGSSASADTPSGAVEGYLRALAAGNATQALSYSSTEPSDKTFLTDAVLQASVKAAPLTAINVPDVSPYSTYATVHASYMVGARSVTADYSMLKLGSSWQMMGAWAEVNLYSNSTFPLYLNGIRVTTQAFHLFPGAYAATSGNKYVGYPADASLLVESPADHPSGSDLSPGLTATGRAAFTAAVKTAVATCVASTKVNPGCGTSEIDTNGHKFTNVKHTLKGTLDGMSIILDDGDELEARTYPSAEIDTSAECGRDSCTRVNPAPVGEASVDFGTKPLTVTWQ